MATYIYETIPTKRGEKPVRYEIQQSMKEKALEVHPETGKRIRRVITGGYGVMKAGGSAPSPGAGASCGAGCGCHN